MLSIHTNLSSLIAQNSMRTSTDKLNQAIERMTTGSKINHAKDNAANYSISTNMTTQLNAYNVAQDNVAMGMDLVSTATDTLNLMQNHGERLRSLATQARNGTYGAQSLSAINGEASAIIAEINRIYMNAEYNGIKFFEGGGANAGGTATANAGARAVNNMPEAKYNGFIDNPVTYSQTQIDAMDSIDLFTPGASGEFKIEDAEDLAKLDTIVESGQDTSNATFVLAKDIDLTDWQNQHGDWNPIGTNSYAFQGTFDGNGHVVKNMRITGSEDAVGLFAVIVGGEIKNLGVINANVSGNQGVGALAGGVAEGGTITNCYATGNVDAQMWAGGLVGLGSNATVTNSYATANVNATQMVAGGLVGLGSNTTVTNSYATGNVNATQMVAGGLVGGNDSGSLSIDNSYATGNVDAQVGAGGLVGMSRGGTVTSSYATGNVNATQISGGLVGLLYSNSAPCSISDSYAYGTVTGTDSVGSLVGALSNDDGSTDVSNFSITNCQTVAQACDPIGGFTDGNNPLAGDVTPLLGGITVLAERPALGGGTTGAVGSGGGSLSLQVGIYGDDSCSITLNTGFSYDLSALAGGIESDGALQAIDDFINTLSEKATHFGAVENRLESALDSIEVNIANLTSSRSTIKDADIAKVSAEYIQQQILQQAAATLMSTANQSPAIALQLI